MFVQQRELLSVEILSRPTDFEIGNFVISTQTNASFTGSNENLIDARLVIKFSNLQSLSFSFVWTRLGPIYWKYSLKISVNFSVKVADFSECFISRMVFRLLFRPEYHQLLYS